MLSFLVRLFLTCTSSLFSRIMLRGGSTGARISPRGPMLPEVAPKRSAPCVISSALIWRRQLSFSDGMYVREMKGSYSHERCSDETPNSCPALLCLPAGTGV